MSFFNLARRERATVGSETYLSIEEATLTFDTLADNLPVNILALDPLTGIITHANRTSIETLKRIRAHLPKDFDADKIIGSSFGRLPRTPGSTSAPSSPTRRTCPGAPRSSSARSGWISNITPVFDAQGRYVAAALTWAVITELSNSVDDFDQVMEQALEGVRRANGAMRAGAEGVIAIDP